MENLSSKRKEKMESISSYHSSLFQFLNKIKCFSEYSNFAIKRTLLCWKYIISHWKIEVYNITPIFIGYIWGFKEGRDWTLVFQMEPDNQSHCPLGCVPNLPPSQMRSHVRVLHFREKKRTAVISMQRVVRIKHV